MLPGVLSAQQEMTHPASLSCSQRDSALWGPPCCSQAAQQRACCSSDPGAGAPPSCPASPHWAPPACCQRRPAPGGWRDWGRWRAAPGSSGRCPGWPGSSGAPSSHWPWSGCSAWSPACAGSSDIWTPLDQCHWCCYNWDPNTEGSLILKNDRHLEFVLQFSSFT